MDRVNNRLAGWKSKLLSRSGRVTLTKFVLNSIPIYLMESLVPSKYLWCYWQIHEDLDLGFIFEPLGQVILCALNLEGVWALICTAREMNVAMLRKHVWTILKDLDKLWLNFLSCKHDDGCSYTWTFISEAIFFFGKMGSSLTLAKETIMFGLIGGIFCALFSKFFIMLVSLFLASLLRTFSRKKFANLIC